MTEATPFLRKYDITFLCPPGPFAGGCFVLTILRLAGAAQHVDELMPHQLLDIGAGGLQVLARIELVGMLVHKLADRDAIFSSAVIPDDRISSIVIV